MVLSNSLLEEEPGRNPYTVLDASQDAIYGPLEQGNEQVIAGNIVSKLTLFNQMKDLKLDRTTNSNLKKILEQRSLGVMANPDLETSRSLIEAYSEWKKKVEIIPPVSPIPAFTNASLIKGAKIAIYQDKIKTAGCVWANKEISSLLENYGLPEDSPVSVIAVEVFGNISSIFEYLALSERQMSQFGDYAAIIKERKSRNEQALSDQLGNYRILRTSPLTEIPFVCCTTCYDD
jgi:hypothetical protein